VQVTAELLERIISRQFPSEDRDKAKEILLRFGTETYHTDPMRVRTAILKLSNGSLEELEKMTKLACIDWRDVLMYAEYPAQSRASIVTPPSRSEKAQLIAADKKQYDEWLRQFSE
jgi:hypothetical protein